MNDTMVQILFIIPLAYIIFRACTIIDVSEPEEVKVVNRWEE